ncbi:hypothetical protein SAMN05216247_102178 [Pseudomonas salomonii]|uniref:Uncharacterized protein n=1 Tax=Pseudomonas salomonii TaxID=191391 RepID=A0A1H3FL22_9PSED|nr:hypothetical protein SAMN05216247_102178 [Pseudomonas salomonii]
MGDMHFISAGSGSLILNYDTVSIYWIHYSRAPLIKSGFTAI